MRRKRRLNYRGDVLRGRLGRTRSGARNRDKPRVREALPNPTGYDLWITGLELPSGRLRPYAELQFLGPVHRLMTSAADWGVQAYAGVTWAVR